MNICGMNCLSKDAVDTDPFFSENQLVSSIKNILTLQNQTDQVDYQIYKVELTSLPGYLQVLETGFGNTQKLIMLHGYGGCSATFFKMFPKLKTHFHIFAIDLYGMGASYRFNFDQIKNFEDAIKTMTTSIHECISNLELDNFYMLGHSMGGYLIPHYLTRFNHIRVRGVFMCSPAGFNKPDEDNLDRWLDRMLSNKGIGDSWITRNGAKGLWKSGMSIIHGTK